MLDGCQFASVILKLSISCKMLNTIFNESKIFHRKYDEYNNGMSVQCCVALSLTEIQFV